MHALWVCTASTARCCSSPWFGAQTSHYFTNYLHQINYSSSTTAQPSLYVLHADPFHGWPILHFLEETVEFFISRAERVEWFPGVTSSLWRHPHPIIMKWPIFPQTPEVKVTHTICLVFPLMRWTWMQLLLTECTASFKLSISSQISQCLTCL